MESELKALNPQHASHSPVSDNDDLPLLKAEAEAEAEAKVREEPQCQPSMSIDDMEKKYAAYVRNDLYGRLGRGELPWVEKLMLGLALVLLVPVRVVAATALLLIYYVICRVCTAFLSPNRVDDQEDYAHMVGWRRIVIVQSGRYLSRVMLFVFGFYWITETRSDGPLNDEVASEDQSEELETPGAIISNHVSYIDILYHMSFSFPSFVAKRSVGNLPLVGLISKCLGCIFVQREAKAPNAKGVSGIVNNRILKAYRNRLAPKIMLFPEGTTTNGEYLLPFKSGAFLAKAPVLPVILRYPYQRLSPAWDSITGARHLILLLCQFVNRIEVTQLPVYYPSEQEKEDPKLYAENVRKLMACEGNMVLSDIGLSEKRIYIDALNGNISMPTLLHQKAD